MLYRVAFSPQAPTFSFLLGTDARRSHSWERTLLACPGVVAGCRLSSTGVTHDIVKNDVKKCTSLGSLTLATTLLKGRKNKFNVAQCGSRAARFRVAPRRVACWLRAKSRAHVGHMWGSSPLPYFIVRRSKRAGAG